MRRALYGTNPWPRGHVDRRRRMALVAAIGMFVPFVMAVGAAIAETQPSASPTSARLEVVGTEDRAVTLRMELGALPEGSVEAVPQAVVRIGGVQVPASARLEAASAGSLPAATSGPTTPTVAMLVLDTSGSMEGEPIEAAKSAVAAFLDALPEGVQVGLVAFADRARVLVAPTTDLAAITNAVNDLRAGGDTALYDAIDEAVRAVPPGEQARLVVLSDGQDTSSRVGLDAAISAAGAAGVPVDVIAIAPTPTERAVLRQLAQSNAGHVTAATGVDQLVEAFVAASTPFAAAALIEVTIPDQVDGRSAPIEADVRIGNLAVTGSTSLPDVPNLAPVDAGISAAILPPVAQGQGIDPMAAALAGIVFIVVLAAAFAWWVAARRAEHGRRIEQLSAYGIATSGRLGTAGSGRGPIAALDRMLERSGRAKRMRSALGASEVNLTPAGWLLARVGICVLLGAFGAALLGSLLVGAVAGVVIGWMLTWTWLRARSTRRQRAFANELPDFLALLASGLRGGLSFNHALESAAGDGRGEVARQMRRALREVQVGTLLDDALMDCADRMDSEDLRWTVTALSIQREVGGNLSTILDTAAATIKGREELRREVQTLSAEGRLSGYILIALPLGVMLILTIIRRSYVELLWTTSLGIAMLVIMGLMMVAGWLWMRAIVRIKV